MENKNQLAVSDATFLKMRTASDAQAFFDLVDADRAELRKWLPWVDATKSPSDTAKYIEQCAREFEARESADFGIWHDNQWVGSIGYHRLDHVNHSGSIGYWLGAEFQGKGIITECVKTLIAYGFEELHFNRIEIRCSTENEKSAAVPKRLNFTFEGIARQNAYINGKYINSYVFSLLKSD